jgi:hypothetical protein
MTSDSADRASWKTDGPFTPVCSIPYADVFSIEEFAIVRKGHVPEDMDDKWFIFFEAPHLYLHRSWTGKFVYRIELESTETGARVREAAVIDDPTSYRRRSLDHEARLSAFLVRRILLQEPIPFPLPEDVPEASLGLYQHTVAGTASRTEKP